MDYPKSVPSVGLVNGKFVDEDPLTGKPGSLIPAKWGNAITEEILNVLKTAGLVPDEDRNDQLEAAIKVIVGNLIPPEKIRTTLAAYGITDALPSDRFIYSSNAPKPSDGVVGTLWLQYEES